jgi:hypothetical protein
MRQFLRQNPSDPTQFWCSYHKAYEPKDSFSPDLNHKWGIAGRCRVACNEYQNKHYQHRPVIKEAPPLKTEMINRNCLKGFIRYFSHWPILFRDQFGMAYSEDAAKIAFQKTKKIKLRSYWMDDPIMGRATSLHYSAHA